MKDYKQFIRQLPNNTIVCALGEFNPPTTAHELLVQTVKVVAEQRSADHIIFTSPSEILSEDKKQQFLSLMFPKSKFVSLGEAFFTSVVKKLNEKYKNVVIIAGADQFDDFKKLKESTNVEVISIGTKDPDADFPKMKQIATKGIYEDFKKLLPSTIRDIDGKRLMNEMRTGMSLDPVKEQLNLVKDKLREKYFRGEIFNVGDIVESNGQQFEIVKRGSNHLLVKEESGALVSKWITDVKVVKEGVIQPNGTDKVETNSPEASGNNQVQKPKGKVKGFLTFYNYDDKTKTVNEQIIGTQHTGSMHHTKTPSTDKFHDKEAKAKIKASLALKQAKEKEALSHKQEKEKLAIQNEALDVSTPTVEEIASKHNVPVEEIQKQLAIGAKVEHEHSTEERTAEEIALDHLNERPDYYKRLKKFVESVEEIQEGGANAAVLRSMKQRAQAELKRTNPAQKPSPSKAPLDKNYPTTAKLGEETIDQQDDRKKQLKRFQKQVAGLVQDRPGISTETKPALDPFFKEDYSEEEIDSMLDELHEEELLGLDEDTEWELVYEDTEEVIPAHPEEEKLDLMEVLSRAERIKGKIRLRRTQAKRERSTKINIQRYSNPQTINKRARRLAIKVIKKRMLRGRNPAKVSVGDKERIEKSIQKNKALVDRVAQKLVVRVRRVEKARMSKGKTKKGTMPSVF